MLISDSEARQREQQSPTRRKKRRLTVENDQPDTAGNAETFPSTEPTTMDRELLSVDAGMASGTATRPSYDDALETAEESDRRPQNTGEAMAPTTYDNYGTLEDWSQDSPSGEQMILHAAAPEWENTFPCPKWQKAPAGPAEYRAVRRRALRSRAAIGPAPALICRARPNDPRSVGSPRRAAHSQCSPAPGDHLVARCASARTAAGIPAESASPEAVPRAPYTRHADKAGERLLAEAAHVRAAAAV
ncbi:RAD51-associated protein 1-like [Schistocerca cancellata]|uniref:RAD51-associated protein 1-like n=1 Tax=Schistocerca cancellata TaxID=274614 RepID=UPI002117CA60|nr:RAD51-associated protein 1-like [Schistocerca cancellata]